MDYQAEFGGWSARIALPRRRNVDPSSQTFFSVEAPLTATSHEISSVGGWLHCSVHLPGNVPVTVRVALPCWSGNLAS